MRRNIIAIIAFNLLLGIAVLGIGVVAFTSKYATMDTFEGTSANLVYKKITILRDVGITTMAVGSGIILANTAFFTWVRLKGAKLNGSKMGL